MNKQDENKAKVRELARKHQGTMTDAQYLQMTYALEEIAQWKDEQFKQLLIEKTKYLSPSAAQDSIKRCTIEKIYRELFNEEIPNSNPYIK